MDNSKIKEKFGDFFIADEDTFKMGIDKRITSIISKRFKNRIVLETCTGAGFTTLSLAKYAKHIFTVEVDATHQEQSIANISKAKLSNKVTFIQGDILNDNIIKKIPEVDSAFLDPDWADNKKDHKYHFINSNTKPPADILLKTISKMTKNIALILPPFIDESEFTDIPPYELQRIYLGSELVLYCLYFGELAECTGETELKISD